MRCLLKFLGWNFQSATFGGACLLMAAVSATAQTRVELGYVFVDGGNGYDDGNWGSVDHGDGPALSFRYDWKRINLTVGAARMDLHNRNRQTVRVCNAITPTVCEDRFRDLRFTDRYRSYRMALGGKARLSQRSELWGELGAVHEHWSNDGGSARNLPTGAPYALDSQSTNQTTWASAIGIDIDLALRFRLSAGLSYQHKVYLAVIRGGYPQEPGSLLEGMVRGTQRFGRHFEGYLEYRPSDQRHWAQVGVGYRF